MFCVSLDLKKCYYFRIIRISITILLELSARRRLHTRGLVLEIKDEALTNVLFNTRLRWGKITTKWTNLKVILYHGNRDSELLTNNK